MILVVFILFPGVWLAAFNSVANPFVYALLMPTYRKCVIDTFCPCAKTFKRATPSKEIVLSDVDTRKECMWRHHIVRWMVVFTEANRGSYSSVQIIKLLFFWSKNEAFFYCCFLHMQTPFLCFWIFAFLQPLQFKINLKSLSKLVPLYSKYQMMPGQ